MSKLFDYIIVGLGKSGRSALSFLYEKNFKIAAVDSREPPSDYNQLQKEFNGVEFRFGPFETDFLVQTNKLIVSPGISLETSALQYCKQKKMQLMGDIELFAQYVDKPVIAITGSNAKSTVTSLVGEMAKAAGYHVGVGGNLGIPALDLLKNNYEYYVLELSSFQLETLESLKPKVSALLNVTADHLDRYPTLTDYARAKQRIYHQSEYQVYNRDDPATYVIGTHDENKTTSFGSQPHDEHFGLSYFASDHYLIYQQERLISVSDILLPGKHNWLNVLASLAIGYQARFRLDSMLDVIKTFRGLPHRCEEVSHHNRVRWYNDSKATNVGATIAALVGLSETISGQLILIAGGQSKNADFSSLAKVIKQTVNHVILLGEDANKIANDLEGFTHILYVDTLEDAVIKAKQLAKPGDAVILSPACASFDMFKNFEHRGDMFRDYVKQNVQ